MTFKKNELFIHEQYLIRTPFFCTDEILSQNFDGLKLLVREASPVFYKTVAHINASRLEKDFDKVHFTIWKYFNRAKYRSVPFGSLASVSIKPKDGTMVTPNIVLEETLFDHVFRDWDDKDLVAYSGLRLINKASYFVTNNTIYYVGKKLRSVLLNNGQFEMNELEPFEELQFLVEYCRVPREKEELYFILGSQYDLNKNSVTQLLIQLTNNQILLTDCTPNIIGKDFFNRIGLNNIDPEKKCYRITQRKYISGPLTNIPSNDLNNLISLLNANLPHDTNTDLNNFRAAFTSKFDRQLVPLSIALDAELGVGYANLETGKCALINSFENVFNQIKKTSNSKLDISPLFAFIIEKSFQKNVVDLKSFIAENTTDRLLLPNSFSMLYHNFADHIVIHHLGGCTANTLIGRFTLCGSDFERLARDVAAIEQEANPNTVFFDVSYRAERHIDNINRRSEIYEYELPLFNWCTSDGLLQLNDIFVCVDQNEVILISKKLGKRLIPRIPTAYNYNRSDLSVYRFLSDLQHQSIRSDLNLSIRKYVPGQAHYARIIYKQIILSPEMWLLDKNTIRLLTNTDISSGVIIISKWLKENKVSSKFSTGTADQNLIFDVDNEIDLAAFYFYCRQNCSSEIYLSEALVGENTKIENDRGKQYHGELLTTLYHKGEVYRGYRNNGEIDYPYFFTTERKLSPGMNWLYVEIYCHPLRSNDILLERISKFIEGAKSNIKKWFFIRYQESGYHLRVRIELKSKIYYSQMAISLYNFFKTELDIGIVSDMQLKTYVREIERYNSVGIVQAESFFYEDTKLVLTTLKKSNQSNLYYEVLEIMHQLVSCTFPQFGDRINFILKMTELFSQEFAFDHKSFKAINKNYKQLKSDNRCTARRNSRILKLLKMYCILVERSSGSDDKCLLLADLIHMHINRVFIDDNRKHEAILYQYLLKDMKSGHHSLKLTVE